MELRELLASRRMHRRFDPDRPVPSQALHRALRAATRGPSAGFSQGLDLVVLQGAADRERYWRTTARPGPPDRWLQQVSTAPCLVLVCSDPGRYLDRYAEPDKGWTDRDPTRWPIPYWDVDAGMGALLALLSAQDEGLVGLLCGVPAERHAAVREAFGIPADRRLVALLALGYPPPAGGRGPRGSASRGRRALGEMVHDGRFGEPWAEPDADVGSAVS